MGIIMSKWKRYHLRGGRVAIRQRHTKPAVSMFPDYCRTTINLFGACGVAVVVERIVGR
jgi:hypothetical protein